MFFRGILGVYTIVHGIACWQEPLKPKSEAHTYTGLHLVHKLSSPITRAKKNILFYRDPKKEAQKNESSSIG